MPTEKLELSATAVRSVTELDPDIRAQPEISSNSRRDSDTTRVWVASRGLDQITDRRFDVLHRLDDGHRQSINYGSRKHHSAKHKPLNLEMNLRVSLPLQIECPVAHSS